ncbi:aspartate/glutamate racemase family protein [Mesorhizobium sp. M1423]
MPGLLKQVVAAEAQHVDAHIIACFDDTGLDAARAIATKPVIGIGEASFHAVSLVAHSFCVVTTLSRSVPLIEDNIRRYGFSHRCRRVFASDIPVLELERPESGASERISEFIREGIRLGAEGIALGCAGIAEFASALQRKHDIPVVDGVGAAVGLAETLIRCGLEPSKRGVWARGWTGLNDTERPLARRASNRSQSSASNCGQSFSISTPKRSPLPFCCRTDAYAEVSPPKTSFSLARI